MSEPTPESTPTPTPTPAPPPNPPAPTPAPAPSEPAPAPQPAPVPQPASSVDELPPWAQKSLAELRAEAAANRVKAKENADQLATFQAEQAKQRDAFAKALGLVTDEPPTAEQLAEQLATAAKERDAERDRARQAAVQLAVFKAASAQQVDGTALLDSNAFTSTLAALDPTSADFGQRVTDAIAAAADRDPRYKTAAAQPPAPPAPTIPKSGSEFGAVPPGPRQWTDEDVQRATPSQLQKAINDGLCADLGFGAKRAGRR